MVGPPQTPSQLTDCKGPRPLLEVQEAKPPGGFEGSALALPGSGDCPEPPHRASCVRRPRKRKTAGHETTDHRITPDRARGAVASVGRLQRLLAHANLRPAARYAGRVYRGDPCAAVDAAGLHIASATAGGAPPD